MIDSLDHKGILEQVYDQDFINRDVFHRASEIYVNLHYVTRDAINSWKHSYTGNQKVNYVHTHTPVIIKGVIDNVRGIFAMFSAKARGQN